jgi:FkbM family methyltransferase
MTHTSSVSTPATRLVRPLWRRMLPEPVRSMGRPLVHVWQGLRGKWQDRAARRADAVQRRALLDAATPIIQDVYGYRFVLYDYDLPRLWLLARHPQDAAEFRAIPRLVRPGDVAFDVGANIGVYSVLLSGICGQSGRIWAFEPVPETCWRLRETLALNRCANVLPIQAAVCESDGIATMNLFDPGHCVWNSLGRPEMGPDGSKVLPHGSIEVPSLSLDSFCDREGIDRINFLKVDVEGFEISVFRGAERLLREHLVDYICFEISQQPLKGAGFRSRQVFAELERWGYGVYELDKHSAAFTGPVRDTNEDFTNLFASAKDMTAL